MNQNRRRASGAFLILGMVFLTIGISSGNKAFTWAAIAFVLISLISGGRWLKPGRK